MLVRGRDKYFFGYRQPNASATAVSDCGTGPFPSPAQSRTIGAVSDIRLLALSEILLVPKDGETMR